MTTDLLPLTEYTHDAPTAATRLALALAELGAQRHDLASFLFNRRVGGRPNVLGLSPVEVFLHARVGADVIVSAGWVRVQHDDWSMEVRCPEWLAIFADECVDGLHPLIVSSPTAGDVHPADVFAAVVR